MKTVTIGDIRQGNTDDVPLSKVYVIRDGTTVLYVGKSKNALTRVESHLGIGQWGWANTGTIISEHLRSNSSDDFTVELYDTSDIKNIMGIAEKDHWLYRGMIDDFASDIERDLITKLSPTLNRALSG